MRPRQPIGESSRAIRDLVKRMIDHHVPQNYIGVVVQTRPLEVALAGTALTLGEDETLLVSHAVRRYDQEHGLGEGDSVLLVPASGGDYVAVAVITERSNLGGLKANADDGTPAVTPGGELVASHTLSVTVGGTPYPVTGTIEVPLVGTTTYYDAEGVSVGEVPLV